MNDLTLEKNFLNLSNHIHHGIHFFRVEKQRNGAEVLRKNGFIRRWLFYPLYSSQSHVLKLKQLLLKNIQQASVLERECFIKGNCEPTNLYLAIQKYNQTLCNSKVSPLTAKSSLAHRISLQLVENNKVLELNPSKVIAISSKEIPNDLVHDKPELVKERRLLKKYQIRRYPGDRIDHSVEAGHIFTSTQKERLLSLIGKVIEGAAKLFNFKIAAFQKYHYRRNCEKDTQIYVAQKNPLSLSPDPSSYWLGHATLLLNVPLKSSQGNVANFQVITDPVEGDLNPLLYPRQTKFARPMEDVPAPHVYLLSHNHLDHYSKDTVKKIFAQQPVMIVPKGDGNRYRKIAKESGFSTSNIIELDWWENKEIEFEKKGERFKMQITATPARHWSGQGPCGGHESTFLGYVIQGHEKGDIYFAGDTARLNEDHIQKLKEHFNICWNFQPGGPDEVRKDMESTHQASVDGLWMHFKIMISKIYEHGMSKEEFLKRALELKTVYMHTMTFKLGNLHLSDTKESVEKVLAALSIEQESGLTSYEKQVYVELFQMTQELKFAENKTLLPNEIEELLRQTIIVPKIGSLLNLGISKTDQLDQCFF